MYYPCSENKGVISFAVIAKLICVFVFACADCWFFHEAAHLMRIYFGSLASAFETTLRRNKQRSVNMHKTKHFVIVLACMCPSNAFVRSIVTNQV